nr:putative ABC transporter ATP-binding protein YheS [Candidatus Pantoea persica]
MLLDNASATINPGQKVGLVGKNGCGKSTLLSLLKGEISSDVGGVTFPANWALARVNQETLALSKAALELDAIQAWRVHARAAGLLQDRGFSQE